MKYFLQFLRNKGKIKMYIHFTPFIAEKAKIPIQKIFIFERENI